MVELSRTTFQEPDLSLPQRKSLAIENKRTVLIGQVVNGGPLPNPPQHIPVCSFDSQHKYRGDILATEPAPSGGRVLGGESMTDHRWSYISSIIFAIHFFFLQIQLIFPYGPVAVCLCVRSKNMTVLVLLMGNKQSGSFQNRERCI